MFTNFNYPEPNACKTQIKLCSKSAINKPKKRHNAISTDKLPPHNRFIFNVNRQNNFYNDHTLVQSWQKGRHDRATINFHWQHFVETSDKATSL